MESKHLDGFIEEVINHAIVNNVNNDGKCDSSKDDDADFVNNFSKLMSLRLLITSRWNRSIGVSNAMSYWNDWDNFSGDQPCPNC